MFRRDFTKSNKEYFKKNKVVLITIATFLIIGMIMLAIFGMNGNFEFNGYNEFSVILSNETNTNFSSNKNKINSILNSFDAKFDSVLVSGEGDETRYVIRYINDIDNEAVLEINRLVAEELKVDVENISDHIKVGGVVETKDYVYTAAAILIIITLASIFCYARYNAASSLAVMLACFIGTLGLISFGSILRLSIGLSYFGILVILNMLITYFAINLFESMHKSSWLVSRDYSTALKTALNSNKTRLLFVSTALLVIGLLFVLFAPLTLKYVALNIMFMSVIVMATSLYIVPFVWNVFISMCRKREYKIKTQD